MPDIMAIVTGLLLKEVQTILIQGNIDIYLDLAWQFSAYRCSGIQALKFVRNQSPTALDFVAWVDIDDGISEQDSEKISEGNIKLLRREQQTILAQTYLNLNSLGSGVVSWLFSLFSENPVPDGPSFWSVVPAGNIAAFDDRWTWITDPTQGMWKLWMDASVNTRKTWVQIPLRTRADDYKLLLLAPIW